MATIGSEVAAHRTTLDDIDAPSIVGLLVLGAITAALVAQGATFGRGRLLLGAFLAAAVVAALATRAIGGVVTAIPAASAMLGAWILFRAVAGGDVRAASGALALLMAVAGTYLLARSEAGIARRWLATGLVWVGAALAVSGWLGVALHWEPLALAPAGIWRAATLITYANASGAVLVALALVAIGLRAEQPSRQLAVATMLLILGASATLSRAGALAAIAGLAALGGLLGWRRLVAAVAAPAAGSACAVAGLLPSLSASDGPQPAVALAGLAAGVAVTMALAIRPLGRLAVGAGICAAGLVVAVALAGDPGNLSTRLVPADRLARTEAAFELWLDDPVIGVGAGPLWLTWEDDRGRSVGAWYVHDEYLQTLVQFGAVGGVLLLLLLGAFAQTLMHGRAGPAPTGLWVGIVAAVAALAVHSAFDFLWHVPAIPVLVAALIGIGAPPGDRQSASRKERNEQRTTK